MIILCFNNSNIVALSKFDSKNRQLKLLLKTEISWMKKSVNVLLISKNK
jgi:hypothetical protein